MNYKESEKPLLSSCRRCKKIFTSTGESLCPECLKEEELLLFKVKRCLYDDPNTSIAQIIKTVGISEELILRFAREERIELLNEEDTRMSCELCGCKITKGRYCDDCKKKLVNELNLCLENKNND